MKLHFRNSQGKLKVVAEPTSEKECNAAIKQFLNEYGFKITIQEHGKILVAEELYWTWEDIRNFLNEE